MKIFNLLKILSVIFLIENVCYVNALPTEYEEVTSQPEILFLNKTLQSFENDNLTTSALSEEPSNQKIIISDSDLETAESEQKLESVVLPVDTEETADNSVAESNLDPAFYGGVLTPEAFQQYMNQFGAAYPYAPGAYPAPIYPGFAPPPPPPIYPSPFVVHTGYEGYLVPSPSPSTATKTSGTENSSSTESTSTTSFMVMSNAISTLMMSTLFRVLATIVSAVGMIFFSGAIVNIFCTYTPICDMSNKAVTYLKRRDTAERMGRMIAEEMTPERVRRAAEFVQTAISKYRELQKLMEDRGAKISDSTR